MNFTFKSSSPEQTTNFAKSIANKLKGGETIELISDLGGGKTTFVKGLAQGIGYQGLVNSPSFSLNNQYRTDNLTLYHFDFYRLNQAGILAQSLAEAVNDVHGVVVVEWGEIVKTFLPKKRLKIKIEVIDTLNRLFNVSCPQGLYYLFDKVDL